VTAGQEMLKTTLVFQLRLTVPDQTGRALQNFAWPQALQRAPRMKQHFLGHPM